MTFRKMMLLTALNLGLACGLVPAQEPSETLQEETRVVSVSHVDAHNVGEALQELGYKVTIAAPDPGRIILRGGGAEVARAVELVKQLDSPGTSASGNAIVAYIPLGHYPANNLVQMIETVAPSGPDTAYALDQMNRVLVVRSDEATIDRVRELVKAVDRSAHGLKIEFFFIQGTVLSDTKDSSTGVPQWLKPVADALSTSGFQNLSLLAPIAINARQGERFSSVSALMQEPNELTFNVEGTANVADEGETVQLEIQAVVQARDVKKQVGSQGFTVSQEQILKVRTTISMVIDRYTVLAAAPAAAGEKAAMAIAIRVTHAE